ncbi:hypothetical protein [Pontibacter akesuensis]|uniref:Uncharacterized protein n=1 Tax=Pontibacter akesuensis TaxID=388950 RepID=A0A1I7K7X5_9BACT|nr:hypothetical protein [Pontibacter akesuensis]GHA74438.1 hypothetical protein GCM10007389_30200 [Pontibacter akesuensis]SFU93506.1 hypothetical protein SAMN04487941_3487 [Pontibacter akesuensis]
MKISFNTTLHSFWHRVLIWLFCMAAGFAIPFFLFPDGQLVPFALTLISLLALAWYLSERFCRGIVRLSLTDAGLSRAWLKQFPMQRRPNSTIQWGEIKTYTIISGEEEIVSQLKLELHKGRTITLAHDTADINQHGFLEFLQAFEKEVIIHNSHIQQRQQIMAGTPFFQTKAGLATVYAVAAVILGTSFFVYESRVTSNYFIPFIASYLIYWVHNQEKNTLRNWF